MLPCIRLKRSGDAFKSRKTLQTLYILSVLDFTLLLYDITCKEKTGITKWRKVVIIKLRKLLAMTLVVAMTGALAAGCGSKSEETGAEGEGEQQTAEWDASNDITVVSREDGSGTRGAFIELFGIEQKDENGNKVDHTTEDANITNSTEVMMSTVAGNEYAIGYVSLGSLGDSVKAVKIDGAEATEENIKAGTYKVSRPFNIATKDEISDIAQDFINFILSEEGQKVVSENGYISLDDVKPYESNGATGKVVVAGSSSVTPVMEKLKEAYQEVNSGAEIEINQSDSTTGMTSAMSGICDIGMASRELKDEEAQELTSIVIATDGIAVIVNNDSPVEELTSDQVKAIFTGETVAWDEIVK